MSSIILCNTGSDCLSQISLDTYKVNKIKYSLGEKPVGPHSIKSYCDKIITANNYNDSVSIFYGENLEEKVNIKIGAKPNDILLLNNKLYTVCGESNAVVVYDLERERVMLEVNTGSWPHSIDFSKKTGNVYVSNMEANSITVIGVNNYNVLTTLNTPEYPTKVKVSQDEKFLYVCESYLGSDESGYLDIFSLGNNTRVIRIKLGRSPMDIYEDDRNIYITNFTDGSVSIVDKSLYKVKEDIYVGGMPRCVISKDNNIFVADYLKGKLVVIENEKIKKVIAIESEPNAMTLY